MLLHTSHTMKAALGPRMTGANIAWLQAIVDAKMLGRKTGSGFYLYPPAPKGGGKKAKGGKDAAWSVLDSISSSALSAISGTDTGADGGDSKANLKLFSSMLTALAAQSEAEAAANKAAGGAGGAAALPANLPVLRTLYATIATCMQVLTGDGYTEAMQAASAAATAHDDANEEFAGKEARAEDTDVALWTAPPVGTARVATSSASEAVFEDF